MDKIIGLCHVCCFLLCLPAFTTQDNILYPYGAEAGDTALPKNDDGGKEINIDIDFPFFDQNHRSLYINTNGIISFLENVEKYTPDSFPLGDNRRVIAPFWADVDTSKRGDVGNIWYRQINNVTKLQGVTDEIMRVFAVDFAFSPFVAEWAVIVTWSNVTSYNKLGIAIGSELKNTFQAVLATDGVHSFTIFNYEKITWTKGASSDVAAQVGFNAGDNKNYYSVPHSRTDKIINITETTNVGRPGTEGRWVFRIDNKEIVAAGCEDNSNSALHIYPEQVSMLGGDVLTISGPCFELSSDVYCRIDGHAIQASYDFIRDPYTVRCPVPILMRLGKIAVELSKDGGVEYSSSGFIVAVGLERQPARVVVSDISTDVLEVNIMPNNFPDQLSDPGSTRIDVYIYSYKEDKVTDEIILKPEAAIKKNFRLSQTTVLVNKKPLTSVDVGIYRVVETGKVDETKEERWRNGQRISRSNTQPIAAMWSLPYNANPESNIESQEWCEEWSEQEDILDIRSDNVGPCPCTLQQAMVDVGRFERDPWCNIDRSSEKTNCEYRSTAKHCVRARMPSNNGRGQLCCYGNDDNLLILKDVPEGGFVQRNHHSGFNPVVHPGTIPLLSNFHNDRVPWEQCCPRSDDKKSCDLFRKRRPSDDCKMYKPPKAGTIFGDPHFISFDGSGYTFNGLGEFHIVMADSPEIKLQARMAETMKDVKATGVIAMTMQSSGSDVIQVELNERRVMDTWHGETRANIKTWSRLAFYQFPYWNVEGVTIEQLESGSEVTVLVTFDTGVAITVTVPENANAMSVIVLVPPEVKGKTTGLLGTWNDDKTDDIQTPARAIIDREDPYHLHYYYGLTWAVSATDSLFRYDIGINHTTVNQLDYTPTLLLGSTVDESNLERVCGDSWACKYDYHKTNNETTARSTKDAEDDFDETDKGTNPVSTCGYLTPPDNGNKDGIVYINGSSVSLTCDNGFRLTGDSSRRCVSGAWSGNVTVCEKVEDVDIFLIIIIAAVIGGVLVLFLCFLCLICLCRKKKKHSKKDHELGALTHPVHMSNGNTPRSGDQDSEAGSYDRPLPMTPEEEASMADDLYANGRVSNGHAGHSVLPVAAAAGASSTSHHNGHPGSSAKSHKSRHRQSHHNHHNHRHHNHHGHNRHHNHHGNHNHNQSEPSHHSHLPGAVALFPMEGQDSTRNAQHVTHPPKKGSSTKAHNGRHRPSRHGHHNLQRDHHDRQHNHHGAQNHDHSEPSTSHHSHLPPGAVAMYPMEGQDGTKNAQHVAHPPKKGSSTKAHNSRHRPSRQHRHNHQHDHHHDQHSHDHHQNHHGDHNQDHIEPSTSRHSYLPPGAVAMYPMEDQDGTRNAQQDAHPPKQGSSNSAHKTHHHQPSNHDHQMHQDHQHDNHGHDHHNSHDHQHDHNYDHIEPLPSHKSRLPPGAVDIFAMKSQDDIRNADRAGTPSEKGSSTSAHKNIHHQPSNHDHQTHRHHDNPSHDHNHDREPSTSHKSRLPPGAVDIFAMKSQDDIRNADRAGMPSEKGSSTSAHKNIHHQPSNHDHQTHRHGDNHSHGHNHDIEPTTSHKSRLPPGAVDIFAMKSQDDIKNAERAGTPSEKGSSTSAHNSHHQPSHQNHHGNHNHSEPSTSRHSHVPPGAVAMFPMEGQANVKDANLVGPPPKKGPRTKARENDYDDPAAVRRGKTRMPRDHRGRELPPYHTNPSDSESEDEIARIKAQMHKDIVYY